MSVRTATSETRSGTRHNTRTTVDPAACRRAADIFRALGDPSRLTILSLLSGGEMCVTELAEALDDNLSAISQRLKLLRSERIVVARREGKHVHYALADDHVAELVANGLAHARESTGGDRTSD